jgi:hypothetical protein
MDKSIITLVLPTSTSNTTANPQNKLPTSRHSKIDSSIINGNGNDIRGRFATIERLKCSITAVAIR